MGAIDEAAANVDWRGIPAVDVERGESDGGAGDVDDGVDRAYFMKMYLVEWRHCGWRLRPGRGAQRLEGRGAGIGCERRFVEDLADGRQITPVGMRMAWRVLVIVAYARLVAVRVFVMMVVGMRSCEWA